MACIFHGAGAPRFARAGSARFALKVRVWGYQGDQAFTLSNLNVESLLELQVSCFILTPFWYLG